MDANPYASPDTVAAPTKRRRWRWWLAWTCVAALATLVLFLLGPAPRTARSAARRSACQNNLKQLAFAMRRYVEEHGCLPPSRTFAADGTPLHSWRTLLLPYVDERKLFESIDLSKPWDDPVNAKARNTPVPVAYRCFEHGSTLGLKTTYQVVLSDEGVFRHDASATAAELAAAEPHTLLVVDTTKDRAVHWMEPRDLDEEAFLGLQPPFDAHPAGAAGGVMLGVSIRGSIVHFFSPENRVVDVRRWCVTTADDAPFRDIYFE